MSTTNLDINLLTQNQNSKYVTANEAIQRLALALSDGLAINLVGAMGDYTPDADSVLDSLVINTTGNMAGDVNLIIPNLEKFLIIRHNGNNGDLIIKTATSATWATVTTGNEGIVWCNGTDVYTIASSAGGGGSATASAKTRAILDGAGGTSDLAIGDNVDPNSVEVYINKLRAIEGAAPYDYTVTESAPMSGNYNQLTPSYSDAFPDGQKNIIVYYYAA